MSERPEADKPAATTTAPKTPPKPEPHPTTVTKPGSGGSPTPLPDPKKMSTGSEQALEGHPSRSTDYRMSRDEYGRYTLENPDGTKGSWNFENHRWENEHGNPYPPEWDGGHRPADFQSGPSDKSPI